MLLLYFKIFSENSTSSKFVVLKEERKKEEKKRKRDEREEGKKEKEKTSKVCLYSLCQNNFGINFLFALIFKCAFPYSRSVPFLLLKNWEKKKAAMWIIFYKYRLEK